MGPFFMGVKILGKFRPGYEKGGHLAALQALTEIFSHHGFTMFIIMGSAGKTDSSMPGA
jgi:hypothetical protein